MTKFKVFSAAVLSVALVAASPAMAAGFGGRGGGGGFGGHVGGGGFGGHVGGGMAMGGGARMAGPSFSGSRGFRAGAMNANASVGSPRFATGGNFTGQRFSATNGFGHRGHWRGGRWIGPAVGFAVGAGLGYGYYDGYAYDDGYPYYGYADNSFVCQPGTYFRGEDGLIHLCQ